VQAFQRGGSGVKARRLQSGSLGGEDVSESGRPQFYEIRSLEHLSSYLRSSLRSASVSWAFPGPSACFHRGPV
jgi:hypothetical protein